jgi:hypothetical protein
VLKFLYCILLMQDAHGRWQLQISAGGLVSALMGVNNYSTLWIGWPGGLVGCCSGFVPQVFRGAERRSVQG